jgi:hypothetical protein
VMRSWFGNWIGSVATCATWSTWLATSRRAGSA